VIKIICSKKNGFRRGGILHQHGANLYPEDFFTPEQQKLLMAEPNLVCLGGLPPTAPGLMSEEELHAELEQLKSSFSKNEPRVLLVEKLKKAIELAGSAQTPETGAEATVDIAELVKAAKQAIADGNTIGSGAPDIKAMEAILGVDVSAEGRNQAWEAIQAEA